MDEHRKRMQEEANIWQKTSVRIIQWVRIGMLVLGIFMLAVLVVQDLGFPKNVDETLSACVITESGEVLSCEVSLKGEVTNYPFKKDRYGMEDSIKVWFGDRWLVEFEYDHGTFDYTIGDAYWSGDTVAGVMRRKRDVLFVEMDVKTIYPEMESQRCVLVAPAKNEGDALNLLHTVSPEKLINSLEWVKKIKG